MVAGSDPKTRYRKVTDRADTGAVNFPNFSSAALVSLVVLTPRQQVYSVPRAIMGGCDYVASDPLTR
jgi:hypothetical protein